MTCDSGAIHGLCSLHHCHSWCAGADRRVLLPTSSHPGCTAASAAVAPPSSSSLHRCACCQAEALSPCHHSK